MGLIASAIALRVGGLMPIFCGLELYSHYNKSKKIVKWWGLYTKQCGG